MGKSAVIMDIGSKYTKLSVITKDKDKMKVSKPTFVESPPDYVLRDKAYMQRLQLKISEMKVRGKTLKVVLNRDNINVIVGSDVMQVAKGMNEKAIRAGIQNKILTGISDKSIVEIDWSIIEQDDTSITYEYAIVKKDIIDTLVKIAAENKLNLESIDVRLSSVINIYSMMKKKAKFAEQEDNEIYALLYIGTKNYNLVCFDNMGIIYTKAESNDLATLDADILMAKMGKDMAMGAGVSFNADGSFAFNEEGDTEGESEFSRKEQLAFRFDEEVVDTYTEYKRRIMNGLVLKVSRQIDKATYKGKRVGIKNLYLIGSSAKLPHIDEYFKENLGVDVVERVDMTELMTIDLIHAPTNCEGMPILPEMYAISVGCGKGGKA